MNKFIIGVVLRKKRNRILVVFSYKSFIRKYGKVQNKVSKKWMFISRSELRIGDLIYVDSINRKKLFK